MKPVVRRVLTAVLGPALAVTVSAAPAVAVAAEPYWLTHTAAFAPPGPISWTATTYDLDAVPTGGGISVEEYVDGDRTAVRLSVSGLRPDREYGAHVHTGRCGSLPEDAGPHYQDRPDPVQPSADPAYANPDNEVWLDLTTDARGAGSSFATQNWRFRAGEARSVVLHDEHTATGPEHAGQAGARLACVTVPFH